MQAPSFEVIRMSQFHGLPVTVLEGDEERHLRLGWGNIWESRREIELKSFSRRQMREFISYMTQEDYYD